MKQFLVPILTVVTGILIYISSVLYDHATSPMITEVPPAPLIVETLSPAATIPDFSVTTLDGRTVHINDLRGSVVILNFWATWCAPCISEFPDLLDIVDQYQGGVILLALSSDQSDPPIQKFIDDQFKKRGQKMPPQHVIIARDQNRQVTRDIFKINTYPESLIIDPDGKIARHIIGIDDWHKAETQDLIKNLVKNSKSN